MICISSSNKVNFMSTVFLSKPYELPNVFAPQCRDRHHFQYSLFTQQKAQSPQSILASCPQSSWYRGQLLGDLFWKIPLPLEVLGCRTTMPSTTWYLHTLREGSWRVLAIRLALPLCRDDCKARASHEFAQIRRYVNAMVMRKPPKF